MTAQAGNTVLVHYCGRFSDGQVFDESYGREPLKFVLGQRQVIEGFENAIIGLEVNQKTQVQIPAAQAYGEYDENMIFSLAKENFPADYAPQIGDELTLYQSDDEYVNVLVKAIEEEMIVLDANHRLAGRDLNFEIELIEVK